MYLHIVKYFKHEKNTEHDIVNIRDLLYVYYAIWALFLQIKQIFMGSLGSLGTNWVMTLGTNLIGLW